MELFNVGDIVCMEEDKYENECWGFIIAIRGEWVVVKWFDGIQSEENMKWVHKKVKEQEGIE